MANVVAEVLCRYMLDVAMRQLREVRQAVGLPVEVSHNDLLATLGELYGKVG